MTAFDLRVARLEEILSEFRGGALVAFSGGADSALLLYEAHRILGPRCVAFTADSPTLPRTELSRACELAALWSVPHRVVATAEMARPEFVENGPERCYFCKDELFATMRDLATELGWSNILYGAIADDMAEYRPGMEAARARGARAPLADAEFTKADVRERSRALGLPTWDKPAAACLSSRFPTGRPITLEELGRIEAAESLLHGFGFPACRVRLCGDAARIEVPFPELAAFLDEPRRRDLTASLKALGFRFVTLDLDGLRSGSTSAPPPGGGEGPTRGGAEAKGRESEVYG